ncbi:hypothetical protein V6Z12_D02G229400 [Gossypium hirsutum]
MLTPTEFAPPLSLLLHLSMCLIDSGSPCQELHNGDHIILILTSRDIYDIAALCSGKERAQEVFAAVSDLQGFLVCIKTYLS